MTNYSPLYGFPAPDGTDLVISGDDAIEALRDAIEAALASDVAQIDRAENGSTISAAPVAVVFPGTQTYMDGFTYAAGSLTYNGPLRLFMIAADVEIDHDFGSGSEPLAVDSVTEVSINGVVVSSSYDNLAALAGISQRNVVHSLTTPLQLAPGDVLVVKAGATPDATVGQCSIRVYPIGPATA